MLSCADGQLVYICNVLDCFFAWSLGQSWGTRMFKLQAANPLYRLETSSARSRRVCARSSVPPSKYMKSDSIFSQVGQTHWQYVSGLATGRGADVSLPARFWRAQSTVQRIAPAPLCRKTIAVLRQSVKIAKRLGKVPAGDGSYSSSFSARFSTSAGSRAAETRLPSPYDRERGLRLCL